MIPTDDLTKLLLAAAINAAVELPKSSAARALIVTNLTLIPDSWLNDFAGREIDPLADEIAVERGRIAAGLKEARDELGRGCTIDEEKVDAWIDSWDVSDKNPVPIAQN